jgi:2-oxoglutarate ferredoxin oxidoreductase subunit alpha
MGKALEGISQVVVVEQNHGGQYYRHLRAHLDLPGKVTAFHRPGPFSLRPREILHHILGQ